MVFSWCDFRIHFLMEFIFHKFNIDTVLCENAIGKYIFLGIVKMIVKKSYSFDQKIPKKFSKNVSEKRSRKTLPKNVPGKCPRNKFLKMFPTNMKKRPPNNVPGKRSRKTCSKNAAEKLYRKTSKNIF